MFFSAASKNTPTTPNPSRSSFHAPPAPSLLSEIAGCKYINSCYGTTKHKPYSVLLYIQAAMIMTRHAVSATVPRRATKQARAGVGQSLVSFCCKGRELQRSSAGPRALKGGPRAAGAPHLVRKAPEGSEVRQTESYCRRGGPNGWPGNSKLGDLVPKFG